MLYTIVVWLSICVVIRLLVKLTDGRCKSNVSLVGKTALITGGFSGLGLATATALAGRGCRIIIADKENCEKSKEKIIKETHNTNIVIKHLNLASLESVRTFAKDLTETEEHLDILVNNAGISTGTTTYTKDGLLEIMQVNYFGAFLLTHLLSGLLKKSAPSRIVFVSSIGAFINNLSLTNINGEKKSNTSPTGFSDILTYGNSKICLLMASNRFAHYLKKFGVTSNALHPGVVKTQIITKFLDQGRLLTLIRTFWHVITYFIAKNVEEGVQTVINSCVANELEHVSGEYFIDCVKFPMPYKARNKEFANQIWEATEKYVKLKPEEKLLA